MMDSHGSIGVTVNYFFFSPVLINKSPGKNLERNLFPFLDSVLYRKKIKKKKKKSGF